MKAILKARMQRQLMQQSCYIILSQGEDHFSKCFSYSVLLVSFHETQKVAVARSCRRLYRNVGWWKTVLNRCSENFSRLKGNFLVVPPLIHDFFFVIGILEKSGSRNRITQTFAGRHFVLEYATGTHA